MGMLHSLRETMPLRRQLTGPGPTAPAAGRSKVGAAVAAASPWVATAPPRVATASPRAVAPAAPPQVAGATHDQLSSCSMEPLSSLYLPSARAENRR